MTRQDIANPIIAADVGDALSEFSRWGAVFSRACDDQNDAIAQEAAMHGLTAIAGMFAVNDAGAHDLLTSMLGMIVSAKQGRRDHVLLRPAAPIAGTRAGLGRACLAAFSITAFRILVELGESERSSRRLVAKLLREHGCTVTKGEHDQPRPISESAIRNWCDGGVEVHEELAVDLMIIHKANLKRRGANTPQSVMHYLAAAAGEAVRQSKMS